MNFFNNLILIECVDYLNFNTYYKYSPATITQLMLNLENAMEFQPPTMTYDVRELM